ncbi:MAG TPA: hypothetical protein VGZ26_10570, partial [Pirellulales bacterium]|nr:hypothetical protein [Pirellulales bacterium]
ATAPVVAPPPVAPPPSDNRYAPPGGSFQYNQSSIDRSRSGNNQGRDHPADETPLVDARPKKAPDNENPAEEDAVKQAVLLSSEVSPVSPASFRQPSNAETRKPLVDDTHSESTELAANGDDEVGTPDNRVRILGHRSINRDKASAEPLTDQQTQVAATLRITADDGPRRDSTTQSPIEEGRRAASNASDSQVAIVARDAVSDVTAAMDNYSRQTAAQSGVGGKPQTAGDAGADYAFAPDYAWLRGRLEYSQTSHQWKLRYIPIDGQTDQFGGSVVLPNSPALEAFKPGDRVAVRGSLAAQGSGSGSFSPLYKFDQVEAQTR